MDARHDRRRFGHPVRRLSRIGIGPVRLGTLKVGELRDLTRDELGSLLDLVSEHDKKVAGRRG